MSRVIHTGQALVDVVTEVPALPRRGQNVMAASARRYAGGAVTTLLAAARFGATCVHAGAHGTGPNGDLVRETLRAEGVTLSAPPVEEQDTATCVVLVEPSAERTFVTALGAEREVSATSFGTSQPQAGDLVCVTGYTLALERTREPLLSWLASLDPGVVVVLDPGAAFAALPDDVRTTMLEHTDVWTSNAEEAADLLAALGRPLPEGADTMAAPAELIAPLLRGNAVTIVRDGAEGCAVHVAGETTVLPGYRQTPVDTNGAGDTHTGVLTAEVARGRDWVEASRRANAAAAIKVTRRGPDTAPTATEVETFLRDH
ncbi:bifunctional hydroxymethylpyrimidine kinase/phosphomethylpyrimidine kinase [Nocardioides rotundus]|uniref:PfkB family carbohydrate kinase n=1 Tax=Nocardioides rotundus TaxID=1774216 RepID=UPI001CBA812A|nr:PfkB family carbohydrate kinase [Nocardioides rotundus]UAL29304.1 bifunctional hydroxymethylpyrimidine kinase/phosphomethylpyrimidine kinase [Nocardioides rotundus]